MWLKSTWDEARPEDWPGGDPLAPAKGIIVALLVMVPIWIAVIVAIAWYL